MPLVCNRPAIGGANLHGRPEVRISPTAGAPAERPEGFGSLALCPCPVKDEQFFEPALFRST
jgi:hypothetical protein